MIDTGKHPSAPERLGRVMYYGVKTGRTGTIIRLTMIFALSESEEHALYTHAPILKSSLCVSFLIIF